MNNHNERIIPVIVKGGKDFELNCAHFGETAEGYFL